MYILDREAQKQLNEQLHLSATGREQDWEIELANSGRLREFINFWPKAAHSLPLKRAMAALLLASYDDYLQSGPDFDVYKSYLYEILKDDKTISDIIDYWSMSDEMDRVNWFYTTPFARQLKAYS